MNRKQRRAAKSHGKAAPGFPASAGGQIAEQFAAAFSHHQAGRLAQAEALYRQICAVDSNHADSLHFLGVIAAQGGRTDAAVDLIGRALALKPNNADAHFNLANVLAKASRPEQASLHYKRVLALDPDFADAHYALGLMLLQQGRSAEATACFERALRLKPTHHEAHYNLGCILQAQGRLDEAAMRYQRALALKPDLVHALYSRGVVLRDLRRPAEALVCFEQALAIKPDLADALNSRGVALRDLNRPAEALASYEKALALVPDYAGAWFNRGSALRDLQHHAEALASYDTALRIKPDMAEAWVGRGLVLNDHLDRSDEALAAYDKALSIKPDIAEAWLQRGEILQKLKRPEEAVISYRQALANGGDAEVIQYTLASLGAGATPATTPRQLVAQLFDQCADRFDEILVGALKYQAPELLLDMIARLVSSRNLDILDLGCGTGLVGWHLRSLAGTLTGVDLSPRMIEMARKREVYDQLVCGELIEFLRTRSENFDLAVAADVFIYIGDLSAVFAGVRGALRAGGFFAFSVESSETQDFVLGSSLRYAQSAEYLRRLANDHEFVLEAIQPEVIRQQDGTDVPGYLVVLRRS